jgi:hypothetical protein
MAVKETIIIDGDASGYVKEAKKASKATKDIKKEAKKSTSVLGKVGNVGKKAFKGVGKAAKGLGSIIKGGLGLGFLLVIVGKITEIFSENQKVVDAVSKVFTALSTVVNQISEAMFDAFTAQSDLNGGFDSTKTVILGLLKVAIFPFKLALEGMTLAMQLAQLAWEESFLGDNDPEKIKELNLAIAETEANIVQLGKDIVGTVGDIVTNVGGMVTEVTGAAIAVAGAASKALGDIDMEEVLDDADKLVALRKAAELAEVNRQKAQITSQHLAEKQRQIRDDEKKSIDERIEANDRLLAIIKKQIEDEKKQINIKVALAQAEYDRTKSNEDLVALKQSQLELLDLEERLEGQKSEHLSNQNGLRREALDITKAQGETELELEEIKKQSDLALVDNALTAAMKEIEIAKGVFDEKMRFLKETAKEHAEGTAARADAENQIALLQAQHDADSAARGKALNQMKFDQTKALLSAVGGLVKEDSIAGKGIALAQVVMDTYRGVSASFVKGALTPASFASAATVLATGLANARKITAVDPTGESSTSSPTSSITSPSQPASFNIVGQGSLNQLNQSIGDKFNQPVRAYVVGSDVTTNDELNRKKLKTATL